MCVCVCAFVSSQVWPHSNAGQHSQAFRPVGLVFFLWESSAACQDRLAETSADYTHTHTQQHTHLRTLEYIHRTHSDTPEHTHTHTPQQTYTCTPIPQLTECVGEFCVCVCVCVCMCVCVCATTLLFLFVFGNQ